MARGLTDGIQLLTGRSDRNVFGELDYCVEGQDSRRRDSALLRSQRDGEPSSQWEKKNFFLPSPSLKHVSSVSSSASKVLFQTTVPSFLESDVVSSENSDLSPISSVLFKSPKQVVYIVSKRYESRPFLRRGTPIRIRYRVGKTLIEGHGILDRRIHLNKKKKP